MKIIIENATNLVKYQFNDTDEVTMEAGRIITPEFIIGDLNSSNASIIENIIEKNDFIGDKYTYENNDWVNNPDWIDPIQIEINNLQAQIDALS